MRVCVRVSVCVGKCVVQTTFLFEQARIRLLSLFLCHKSHLVYKNDNQYNKSNNFRLFIPPVDFSPRAGDRFYPSGTCRQFQQLSPR